MLFLKLSLTFINNIFQDIKSIIHKFTTLKKSIEKQTELWKKIKK